MSLKLLVATALDAVDIADDTVFSAEMKTTLALDKLRELKRYLEVAPKTAAELVDGCEPVHNYGYVEPGSYLFTRRQLEDFAQTAFAAGLAYGKSFDEPEMMLPREPVHDYNHPAGKTAAQDCVQKREIGKSPLLTVGYGVGGAQPGPAPAAVPIRTSDASVDLQFSDGTCVTVRVVGK